MPKVLDAFKALQPRWHPFVITAFFAGLRYSELAALYRDDLDVQRGLLTVERGMSGGKVAPTKTSTVRKLKVSPALLKVLRDHMEAMALDAQAGQWSAESRRWMFPTTQSNPPEIQPLPGESLDADPEGREGRASQIPRDQAFVRGSSPDMGADPRFVADQLGHSRITLTLDTYGRHIQKSAHDHVLAALNKLVW